MKELADLSGQPLWDGLTDDEILYIPNGESWNNNINRKARQRSSLVLIIMTKFSTYQMVSPGITTYYARQRSSLVFTRMTKNTAYQTLRLRITILTEKRGRGRHKFLKVKIYSIPNDESRNKYRIRNKGKTIIKNKKMTTPVFSL
jgi:hypothetical protein